MVNKIGKVFRSSTKAPRALRSNINRTTGMLKAGLNEPSKMQKLARNLNNLDDAIGKVNTTAHKNLAKNIGISGYIIGHNSDELLNAGRYKSLSKAGSSIGTKLENSAIKLSKYDKAVGFDVKRAIGNDLKLHANQALNFAGSMFEQSDKNLLGIKLNTKGKVVAGGMALMAGTKDATTKFNQNTMGRRDSQITPHAPSLPAYANNGGATGDLVFALNANRRG